MRRIYFGIILVFWTVMILSLVPGAHAKEPEDVIARVGDQIITFSQIDTMINSSAIIGLDIPAYGTPERNTTRLSILDKVISANLVYLDALKKGVDKNPVYRHDMDSYAESTLASLYKEKVLIGEVPVTDEEVEAFFNNNIQEGTEFTEDVKLAIAAKIRKQRFKDRTANMRVRLRQGVKVSIDEKNLNPENDETRKSDTVVATIEDDSVTWGQVRTLLISPSAKDSREERTKALNRYIDGRIMAKKGREAGLEKDPVFQARLKEYRKTRLINLHRTKLVEDITPDDKEIREYFKKNKEKIAVAEVRKIQMVVLKTREEAEEVKKKIDNGEITIFEAARDYSIDPNAKMTLGEMGWVSEGTGFPELSKLTFSLEVNELGGPVESPAGWHLVKILDLRDAMHEDIEEKNTWNKTRRMMIHEKLDQYTTNLRINEFKVEVYEDVFNRIAQAEVDMMQKKRE